MSCLGVQTWGFQMGVRFCFGMVKSHVSNGYYFK
jgi:hypothetical protein